MAITTYYDNTMPEETGKGRIAEYKDVSADTKAAGGEIGFGKVVELDETGEKAIQFEGGVPFGIAMAKHFAEYDPKVIPEGVDVNVYKEFDAVSVVRKGIVWVEVLEDVVAGDAVAVDDATGDFRPGDTAETDSTELPGAQFKSSAIAGNLAKVELNLPA